MSLEYQIAQIEQRMYQAEERVGDLTEMVRQIHKLGLVKWPSSMISGVGGLDEFCSLCSTASGHSPE